MGAWIDGLGREMKLTDVSDAYINNLIGLTAMGCGRSSAVVLGCLDELYDEADRRRIFRGLKAWLVKKYTKRVWERIARHEKSSKPFSWHMPLIVRSILKRSVPRKALGRGEE